MELVLALSMQLKPLTTGLICDMGGYSLAAVVQALNAVRLHGHAQMLAAYTGNSADFVDGYVERAKREILGMALEGEEFDFDVKVITNDGSSQARRIDIRLKTEKR